MKKFFREYALKKEWLVEEEGWEPILQPIRESRFSQGNGYLGMRGVLEERPQDSTPGTFVAGIFDARGAITTELVNLPNPLDFHISIKGEKIDVSAMDVLDHRRALDMEKGLLLRRTLYSNVMGRKYEYKSLRFLSMADDHIGVIRVWFTPLDMAETITVYSTVDYSVYNKGTLTEGDKMHYSIKEVADLRDINYFCFETFERKHLISYATCLEIAQGEKSYYTTEESFHLRLKKGETACFTKTFAIYDSRFVEREHSLTGGVEEIRDLTTSSLQESKMKGFDRLFIENANEWRRLWDLANVEIRGDPQTQKALRFNMYHLMICGSKHLDMSVGARTLSGVGYRGHIFWDAEIFILPFFVHTNPVVAKNMLLYRFNRVDAARRIAKRKGYRGVLFPWESADTGEEVTPSWSRDLDKTIKKISTMEQEHHIVSDVSYGVYYYYKATGDEEFLRDVGSEIIFETARFWASRVEYNEEDGCYEIKNVMGPDEFHEGVDNNVYTNLMAQWNLETAVKVYGIMQQKHPEGLLRLKRKIRLKTSEIIEWRRIAERIKMPILGRGGIIEQFDGYLKKRNIKLPKLDRHFMVSLPLDVDVKDFAKTQLIKQADVVMLFWLLQDKFDHDIKSKNYEYYQRRTLHSSSLSPSVYSIVGAEIGRMREAFWFFLYSLYMDLKNLHGSTHGIHAASLGGTWQAFMNGFMGMMVEDEILSFNPRLPRRWKEVRFKVRWHDLEFSVTAYQDRLRILYNDPKHIRQRLEIKIYGKIRELDANKEVTFHK